MCARLWSFFRRHRMWYAASPSWLYKPLANENELKGMEIIMSEFSGLHHD